MQLTLAMEELEGLYSNSKKGSYFYHLVHDGNTGITSIVSTSVSRLDRRRTVGIFKGSERQIWHCVIDHLRSHTQVSST